MSALKTLEAKDAAARSGNDQVFVPILSELTANSMNLGRSSSQPSKPVRMNVGGRPLPALGVRGAAFRASVNRLLVESNNIALRFPLGAVS